MAKQNDNNSEKEMIAEEVHDFSSSSSSSSSEENAVDTTAPPPLSPTVDGGVAVAGGDVAVEATATEVVAASSVGAQNVQAAPPSEDQRPANKKRGRRPLDLGASSSGGDPKKPRKKNDLLEEPKGRPNCYLCGKTFKTWKGVFGHLRAHKLGEERQQRGAFPPPAFIPSGKSSPSGAGSSSGTVDHDVPREVLEEQLMIPTLFNIAQEVLLLSSSASTSSRADGLNIDLNQPTHGEKEGGGGGGFDLNKPPPPDDQEGDDDKHGK